MTYGGLPSGSSFNVINNKKKYQALMETGLPTSLLNIISEYSNINHPFDFGRRRSNKNFKKYGRRRSNKNFKKL